MRRAKSCLCATMLLLISSVGIAAESKSLSTYVPPSEEQGGWRTLLPESGDPDAQQKAKNPRVDRLRLGQARRGLES